MRRRKLDRPLIVDHRVLMLGLAVTLAAALLLLLSLSVSQASAPGETILRVWTVETTQVIDRGLGTAKDSVRGADILGGERDVLVSSGSVRFEWDGDEGDPTSTDHTGLGGVDLTAGGLRDHFTLRGAVGAANATLTVYTDENRSSSASFAFNGGDAVALYFAEFAGQADFSNVGAIALQIEGNTAGFTLDTLALGSSLAMSRADVLVVDNNGDGLVDPGDMVEHRVTLQNESGRAAGPVTLVESVAGRTWALVNGSVTVSDGFVASGNEAGQTVVKVTTAGLADGEEAAIAYRTLRRGGPPPIVSVVVQDNDTPPGGGGAPVSTLNGPFTNGNGEVGFTGSVISGTSDYFVWFDSGIVWLNSTAAPTYTLSGAEGTMGIGDNGEFIYSPSTDGDDSVWTQNGPLLVEGMPAPGYPPTTTNTFNSRPTMQATGAGNWVAGFNDAGGTTTLGRVLYTSSDGTPGTITPVLASDDIVSGLPIDRPSGIDFDYMISDNGSNHIQALLMDTGSTTDDGAVYLNGALIARETFPSGDGDNWDNFDIMTINDAGNYVFSGDTDGATTSDEFIAYNGAIAIREGDTISGTTLTSSAFLRAGSINNLGWAAHAWGISGGTELLFAACDAADLANSSVLLLATNDMVDVDGNGTPDATVTDFNASTAIGPGLWLAEDGRVYVEVDLDYGAGDLEAIIGMDMPCGGAAPAVEVDPAAMSSVQPADTQVTQTLTISNSGTADLNWTLTEAPVSCDSPADVTWLSEAPTAGTTTPGGADAVDVIFDSTGLAPNTYTADLCVNSNDPLNSTVAVPVTLTIPVAPSITLSKTVGLDPNACAAGDSLDIPAGFGGTAVTYCYTVQNTGNVTFTLHDLVDDRLGTLLSAFPFNLPPGASTSVTQTVVITQTTVNSATWTAMAGTMGVTASASDTATVTRLAPTGVGLSAFGADVQAAVVPAAVVVLLLLGGMAVLLRRRTAG